MSNRELTLGGTLPWLLGLFPWVDNVIAIEMNFQRVCDGERIAFLNRQLQVSFILLPRIAIRSLTALLDVLPLSIPLCLVRFGSASLCCSAERRRLMSEESGKH